MRGLNGVPDSIKSTELGPLRSVCKTSAKERASPHLSKEIARSCKAYPCGTCINFRKKRRPSFLTNPLDAWEWPSNPLIRCCGKTSNDFNRLLNPKSKALPFAKGRMCPMLRLSEPFLGLLRGAPTQRPPSMNVNHFLTQIGH